MEMMFVQEKIQEWIQWIHKQQNEYGVKIEEYQLGMEFQIIVKEYSNVVEKLNLIETHVHRLQKDCY
jgi:predicted transcriptional regulator